MKERPKQKDPNRDWESEGKQKAQEYEAKHGKKARPAVLVLRKIIIKQPRR